MNTQKPLFDTHLCGLGTFLDIANKAIQENLRNGTYTSSDASSLQTQTVLTLYNIGAMAETLGMEHIDYSDNSPQKCMPTALMLFGRVVQEMAYCFDTVTPYVNQHNRNKGNTPADDTFPPPDGC